MSKADQIAKIAEDQLGITILESRGLDDLDFYDLDVISIKEALEDAYQAGKDSQ